MTPDELSWRLLEFAARVGKVVDALPDRKRGEDGTGQFTIYNGQFAISKTLVFSCGFAASDYRRKLNSFSSIR